MATFCECGQQSFGKDKITGIPYCKGCQYKRTDLSKLSINQKAMGRQRTNPKRYVSPKLIGQVRDLALSDANVEMTSRQAIKADLDYVTSRIVRLMAADKDGIAVCYTCVKKQHWSLMDACHYISRAHTQFRYDYKNNIRCGCKTCNQFEGGQLEKFKEELDKEQPGLSDWLEEQSRQVEKISTEELKAMLIAYRQILKPLEIKKSLPK